MEPKIRTTTSSLVNEMQLWKWMEGDYLNGEPKFEAHLKKLGLAFDGESVCIGRTNDVAYPARSYWCEDLRTFVHIAFMTVEHSGITEPTGAVPVFVEIFGNQY